MTGDAPVSGTTLGYRPEQPAPPPGVRIGDRVRCVVGDDVNVSVGLTGLVTNTVPARWGQAARARVVWDSETISIADASSFVVLPRSS